MRNESPWGSLNESILDVIMRKYVHASPNCAKLRSVRLVNKHWNRGAIYHLTSVRPSPSEWKNMKSMLVKMPRVTKLEISGICIDDEQIQQLSEALQGNRQLKEVDLSGAEIIGRKSMQIVQGVLACQNLHTCNAGLPVGRKSSSVMFPLVGKKSRSEPSIDFDVTMIKSLTTALRISQAPIRVLNLRTCSLTQSCAEDLGGALATCKYVEELALPRCFPSVGHVICTLRELRHCTRLHDLRLNFYWGFAMNWFSEAVEPLCTIPALKTLGLTNIPLSQDDSHCISKLVRRATGLTSIDLSSNPFKSGFDDLLEALNGNQTLKKLTCRHCSLEPRADRFGTHSNSSLEEVDLSSNPHLFSSWTSIAPFARFVQSLKMLSVLKLSAADFSLGSNLLFSKIPQQEVLEVLFACPRLQTLVVKTAGIDEHLFLRKLALNSTLTSVELETNFAKPIPDPSCFMSLFCGKSPLRSLSLGSMLCRSGWIDGITKCSPANFPLQRLDLGGDVIDEHFFAFLSHPACRLKYLKSSVLPQLWSTFWKTLESNTSLEEFQATNELIDSEDFTGLYMTLQSQCNLKRLSVRPCNLKPTVVCIINECLAMGLLEEVEWGMRVVT